MQWEHSDLPQSNVLINIKQRNRADYRVKALKSYKEVQVLSLQSPGTRGSYAGCEEGKEGTEQDMIVA